MAESARCQNGAGRGTYEWGPFVAVAVFLRLVLQLAHVVNRVREDGISRNRHNTELLFTHSIRATGPVEANDLVV